MTKAKKGQRRPASGAVVRKASTSKKAASAVREVVDSSDSAAVQAVEAAEVVTAAAAAAAVVDAPLARAASPAGLKLEASCTLRDSIDMQFQLLAVDFGDSDVLVDGSAVERIDTSGLQMLLSFVKHQAARGKPVHWTAVSPELLHGSRLLGLTGMLGIADPASGSQTRGN